MVGFVGPNLPEYVRRWLEDGLFGVFLFPPNGNYVTPQQVSALCDEVHAAGPNAIVAVDQEGGRVQAWGPPHVPAHPSAATLGTWRNADVEKQGEAIGRELAEIGVDLNFAPVLDVNTRADNPIIGDRSFSSDPTVVAARALAFSRGLATAGILACGKHFPGHGDTARDSHVDLPVVDRSLDVLMGCEVPPFSQTASVLPMMMTAHVVFPALDPDVPATHSSPIMTDLLRRKLGFDGVLISDDLAMKGIRQGDEEGPGGLGKAAVAAIQAGCDVVLSAFEHDDHAAMLDAIERALTDGTVTQQFQVASAARRAKFQQARTAIQLGKSAFSAE